MQRLLSYHSIRIEVLADNLSILVPHIINHYWYLFVHNYAYLFGAKIDGVKYVIQKHLGELTIQGVD
jgi:hypothetical protein